MYEELSGSSLVTHLIKIRLFLYQVGLSSQNFLEEPNQTISSSVMMATHECTSDHLAKHWPSRDARIDRVYTGGCEEQC